MIKVHGLVSGSVGIVFMFAGGSAVPDGAFSVSAECSGPAEQWVEYYAAMSFVESPFEDIVGVHRLTDENASGRNHWRLGYGSDRRLRSVVFSRGDVPRAPDHSGNALSEAAITEICYLGDLEVRRFRDAHGNPVYIRGNVAEERYQLDSMGYRRALTFHDADGVAIENGWGIARYSWETFKDGTVVEERFDASGKPAAIRPGFPFYRLRLHFGPGGWLALMENIDSAGRLVENEMNAAQDKLEFSADGHMRGWNVYDGNELRAEGNGPRVARGLLGYNSDGLEWTEHYRDRDGRSMENAYGFTKSFATFDRFGNMLTRFNHDSEGRRMINPRTGYAGYVFKWDASGLYRLSVAYLDADGNPALHAERGYHSTQETYDAAGDPVELRYLDVRGRPVNRIDNGVAVIRTTFDERHRPVLRSFFNAAGAPVRVGQNFRYRDDGYALR